ncbi:MAG: hypothetical protein WAL59_10190, partial [Roseiarcus sp.]
DDDDDDDYDDDDDNSQQRQQCLISCQGDYANCVSYAGCGENFNNDLSICATGSLTAISVATAAYSYDMSRCAALANPTLIAVCSGVQTLKYNQAVSAAAASYDSCKSNAAATYANCLYGDCFSGLADCMKGCIYI